MDKKTNSLLRKLLCLTLVLTLVFSMTACKDRSEPSGSSESSDSSSQGNPLDEPEPGDLGEPEAPKQDVVDKIVAAYNKNNDVVGWLSFPNTTIDAAVMQGDDNVYYERKNELKQYNWYGCYFADAGNTFGTRNDLTANTIIYGHNMSDKTDDVKFSQLFKLIDFNGDGVVNKADESVANPNLDFATNNPYLYFSTADDDMVWIIYAAFFTDTSFQYHLEKPDAATFQKIIDEAKSRSELIYDVDVKTSDKILTLSTCTYKYGGESNKEQRFVVQARLLRAGEKVEETVKVTKNPNPKAPTFSNGY